MATSQNSVRQLADRLNELLYDWKSKGISRSVRVGTFPDWTAATAKQQSLHVNRLKAGFEAAAHS